MPREFETGFDSFGSVRFCLLEVVKMRNLKVIMLITLICLWGITAVTAQNDSNVPSRNVVNLPARATVPVMTPEINCSVWKVTRVGQNPQEGVSASAMDFGELVKAENSAAGNAHWYSPNVFCVRIQTFSYGQRYEIKNTCEGLASSGTSLPAGSFRLEPNYSADDAWLTSQPQGPMPDGAELGSGVCAIGANKLIYRSEPSASNRILRAYYTLSEQDDSADWEAIPLTQPAGVYQGVATITITAV